MHWSRKKIFIKIHCKKVQDKKNGSEFGSGVPGREFGLINIQLLLAQNRRGSCRSLLLREFDGANELT